MMTTARLRQRPGTPAKGPNETTTVGVIVRVGDATTVMGEAVTTRDAMTTVGVAIAAVRDRLHATGRKLLLPLLRATNDLDQVGNVAFRYRQ